MTVTSEDIGKQVSVVRDLEREYESESSVWIGHEGTLLRIEDTVFYIVKFSAKQMPKNMNIENNEAWFSDTELGIVSSSGVMDSEIKNWIDNASYEQLLSLYRHAPVGSPYFQGETGDYYKKVMQERKAQEPNPVQVSKNVGW